MSLAALHPSYDMALCPFCKGKRCRVHKYSSHGTWYRVQCLTRGCEAQGPRRADEAAAMEAWNDRSGPG